MLNLRKVDASNETIPVAGAVYEVRDSGDSVVGTITTDADGWAHLALTWGNYTVKEKSAPSGYELDPTVYNISIGPNSVTVNLFVKNNRTPGGGGETPIKVAGLVQVLAFTGVDPWIPITGVSVLIGGLSMLIASLARRFRNK